MTPCYVEMKPDSRRLHLVKHALGRAKATLHRDELDAQWLSAALGAVMGDAGTDEANADDPEEFLELDGEGDALIEDDLADHGDDGTDEEVLDSDAEPRDEDPDPEKAPSSTSSSSSSSSSSDKAAEALPAASSAGPAAGPLIISFSSSDQPICSLQCARTSMWRQNAARGDRVRKVWLALRWGDLLGS